MSADVGVFLPDRSAVASTFSKKFQSAFNKVYGSDQSINIQTAPLDDISVMLSDDETGTISPNKIERLAQSNKVQGVIKINVVPNNAVNNWISVPVSGTFWLSRISWDCCII
jgi:hypothetical protein